MRCVGSPATCTDDGENACVNFCSRCAAPVALRIPPGDDRPRHVCDACGTIHYQKPEDRRGMHTGARREGPALPPGDRAEVGTVDASGRVHGERRDDGGGGGPGNARRGQRPSGDRRPVRLSRHPPHQPGLRDVPWPPRRGDVLARCGESGRTPVRRVRGALGRDRVSGHRARPRSVVPGPMQRRVRDPYRGHPPVRATPQDPPA